MITTESYMDSKYGYIKYKTVCDSLTVTAYAGCIGKEPPPILQLIDANHMTEFFYRLNPHMLRAASSIIKCTCLYIS